MSYNEGGKNRYYIALSFWFKILLPMFVSLYQKDFHTTLHLYNFLKRWRSIGKAIKEIAYLIKYQSVQRVTEASTTKLRFP